MNRKRIVLMTFFLVAAFASGPGHGQPAAQKQSALNRQLIVALIHADTKRAIVLVKAGADPNTPYKPTPTRSPATKNDSPTALLIACGAEWNADYATFLAQMRAPEAPQLVQAMLEHGANVRAESRSDYNRPNSDLWTPLLWALRFNRRDTVAALLEHGADVNVQVGNGWTPLMYACLFGRPTLVQLLLEHKADANVQDLGGWTALYRTVLFARSDTKDSKYIDIIRQLMAHGANPNLADNAGETALQLAQRMKRPDIVALLEQAGARK
jgi:ankyrin repeat protein